MIQFDVVIVGGAVLVFFMGYSIGKPRQRVDTISEIGDHSSGITYDPEVPKATDFESSQHPSIPGHDKDPDDDAGSGESPSSNTTEGTTETTHLAEMRFDWRTGSSVDFDDVGGMDEIIRELTRDVVLPLTTHRDVAEKMGIPVPNILLYGPPGTGKTHLAKALASELDVPWVQLNGSTVQSKWINESATLVNELFTEAKEVASQEDGAVIFIDELDSVLRSRGAGNAHNEDEKVVNEFLAALQETEAHDILFIGATNRPEIIDSAGTRSGRIDKQIEIGVPDQETRKAIIQTQLDSRPHSVPGSQISHAAHHLEGATAADIESIVIDAARQAVHGRHGDTILGGDLFQAVEAFKVERSPDRD